VNYLWPKGTIDTRPPATDGSGWRCPCCNLREGVHFISANNVAVLTAYCYACHKTIAEPLYEGEAPAPNWRLETVDAIRAYCHGPERIEFAPYLPR